MRLSIIIPVYRVEETLDRCVKSIVEQGIDDLEVVLVDDGSPDRCPQLCDEWAQRDQRVSVIHKSNGGLSDARNAGIEQAKGDYITFVDSDDFIAPDTYEPLLRLLSHRSDIDMLEFPFYWHFGAKEQRIVDFGEKYYADTTDYWLNGHAYEHAYAWNKLYRRELFLDVRFPKGRVFEDIATLPLLLASAKLIATTHQGLYYYSANPKGITATAKGREMSLLLDSHLSVLSQPAMLRDARYYMHVLNIQMDVCELTGDEPLLPACSVNPLSGGLSLLQRIKALVLNIVGIQKLCKLNIFLHQIRSSRS